LGLGLGNVAFEAGNTLPFNTNGSPDVIGCLIRNHSESRWHLNLEHKETDFATMAIDYQALS
jgi:hypothetical protein